MNSCARNINLLNQFRQKVSGFTVKKKVIYDDDDGFIKKHYEMSESVLKDSLEQLPKPEDYWNPYLQMKR